MSTCRHCEQVFEPGDPCPSRTSTVHALPCEAVGDGELVMRYADGTEARLNVPKSAICRHNTLRMLCKECKARVKRRR